MNLENAGLQDRVIDLEKRSAEQANELACLRSSLADCLRRLNLLESARGMKLHSSSRKPVLHNNGTNVTKTNSRTDSSYSSRRHTNSRNPTSTGHQSKNSRDSSLVVPHSTTASTTARTRLKSPQSVRLSSSSTTLNNQGVGVSGATNQTRRNRITSASSEDRQFNNFNNNKHERDNKTLSMYEYNDMIMSRQSEPITYQQKSSTLKSNTSSRYYEASTGPSGYTVFWRSAYDGELDDIYRMNHCQSPPGQQHSVSVSSSFRKNHTVAPPPPPPPPPALPPSSLCIPPNLVRRGRQSSGPSSSAYYCATDSDDRSVHLTSTSRSLHPTAWKPGGVAICPANREMIQSMNKPSCIPKFHDDDSKETTYLPGDGILRFYIRGRPVNVYMPTQIMQNYDLSIPLKAPDTTLKLEWIYGYRGRDCRNNLHYLPTGELIYFVAAVVVLYNIEEQCQRHYLEHTDDVKCIAIHPDRITVATGQSAGHDKQFGKPHVRIWSSVDLKTLKIIGLGEFERSVCCLSFSKTDSGVKLCAVDEATDHVISIWDWQKSRKITETKCSTEPITAVEFHPLDDATLVSGGKGHLAFWTFDGCTLSKKMGIFENGKQPIEKPKFILCLTFAENGDLLTGDSAGNIIAWKRGTNTVNQICQGVHEGGIFSLCLTNNGHLISGGGKDRRLVFFDAALNPTGRTEELTELYGSVRTITQGPGELLIIGTTKNMILQAGPGMEISPLMFGHFEEFWSLAKHPQAHQFITGGRDHLVILWDSLSKQAIWSKEFTDAIHCAAFYPPQSVLITNGTMSPVNNHNNDSNINGNNVIDETNNLDFNVSMMNSHDLLVVLGTSTGRWLVFNCLKQEIIAAHSDGLGEQIECVAYSPDGNYLALGSRDNVIYVYNVLERGYKYNRVGRCCGHTSFILHIDWSVDGRFIRSVSGDYEILFWTAFDCRQVVSPSTLRDLEWASQTCTLGWEVAGIWPSDSDGTDVNACDRSPTADILATGDDYGKVKLFKYPTNKPKAEFRAYNGHSSHVTNVTFLYDGSRLISTGGKDTAVLQWEVCI
uniref:Putative WD-repeat protein n=1 Tax=Schistosoma mansoni TaxID=6183 RepID=A0A3Q0KRN3_SCHMA